jgi:hypothetical protein
MVRTTNRCSLQGPWYVADMAADVSRRDVRKAAGLSALSMPAAVNACSPQDRSNLERQVGPTGLSPSLK